MRHEPVYQPTIGNAEAVVLFAWLFLIAILAIGGILTWLGIIT